VGGDEVVVDRVEDAVLEVEGVGVGVVLDDLDRARAREVGVDRLGGEGLEVGGAAVMDELGGVAVDLAGLEGPGDLEGIGAGVDRGVGVTAAVAATADHGGRDQSDEHPRAGPHHGTNAKQ
jgi:hypothetical protein